MKYARTCVTQSSDIVDMYFQAVLNIIDVIHSNTGVAKLLDSPIHFSKFEIFRELQLNTYLKGMQKEGIKKLQKLYLLKTYK